MLNRIKTSANITQEALKKELKDHGVKLITVGLDEVPFVYKNMLEVMKNQTTLVDVLIKFYPVIVQMFARDGTDGMEAIRGNSGNKKM